MLLGRVGTAVPGVERTPGPSRVSRVRNMETLPRVRPVQEQRAGRPIVRGGGIPWRDRMPKKRMPVAERQQESEARGWLLRWLSRITGRIPGFVPGRESVLTCGR